VDPYTHLASRSCRLTIRISFDSEAEEPEEREAAEEEEEAVVEEAEAVNEEIEGMFCGKDLSAVPSFPFIGAPCLRSGGAELWS
jgi:hypothetical protein